MKVVFSFWRSQPIWLVQTVFVLLRYATTAPLLCLVLKKRGFDISAHMSKGLKKSVELGQEDSPINLTLLFNYDMTKLCGEKYEGAPFH